ncbi:MAG: UDP-N-acetylmuramate--L-alanine ligase [Bacteroidales bacterium]|nr:UDP-N-acetylmuramate--L-alanine ligase [Bacteroidales bacterium]
MDRINRVYLIGVGGIGMSALARYFNALGKEVAGYDVVSKPLTQRLESEGVIIHYEDEPDLIPSAFTQNKKKTLIVYTPAVPSNHKELNYFREKGYTVLKRSEVLGEISKTKTCLAVAGTHGKTSVSSLIAHLLNQSSGGCNAFLGGVTKNYQSNVIVNPRSPLMVVEADEFDRSFLQLNPNMAVITSMDADHLDVYNNEKSIHKAFEEFTGRLPEQGVLLYHHKVPLRKEATQNLQAYTYSLQAEADFYPANLTISDGKYRFDLVTPRETLHGFSLPLPGLVNVENALAALSLAYLQGIERESLYKNLNSFQGIERRFDIRFHKDKLLYIDDYAHHPVEIAYTIRSVREFYPNKRITGIFQPHLYSRTQYFAKEFAESLEMLDELILLDIYPAREEPIEGVTSQLILNHIQNTPALLTSKKELMNVLSNRHVETLMTLGAGDIDQMVGPIHDMMKKRAAKE